MTVNNAFSPVRVQRWADDGKDKAQQGHCQNKWQLSQPGRPPDTLRAKQLSRYADAGLEVIAGFVCHTVALLD